VSENTDNIAVCVSKLSKCYQIYDKPQDRLKQGLWRGRKQFFREFWALKDVSFKVKKGEAVGIIGRNGSGKSTLLQLICGTLTPTSGQVEVNGRVAALLELGAGFSPDFTGRENVYMNAAILGLRKEQTDAKFHEVAEFAEIGEFMEQPVKTYSSGMFVRLAFAVQVCVEPDILVVDEALAVGDVFFRQRCYERLRRLREAGTAIILVSHSMAEVEQFCSRGLLLHQGEQRFLGTAIEAAKRYYIVEQSDFRTKLDPPSVAHEHYAEKKAGRLSMPEFGYFDISSSSQVSSGRGKLLRVALLNEEGEARVFHQGDVARFFYEFLLETAADVPTCGLEIVDDRKIIVHGKTSIEHNIATPTHVNDGTLIRVHQHVQLDLAVGDYTFNLGLGRLTMSDYLNRYLLKTEDLYGRVDVLCIAPSIGSFSIIPRNIETKPKISHHGVADLSGFMELDLVH
jgi:lipopolysaccharide transport system ATP-binding protein